MSDTIKLVFDVYGADIPSLTYVYAANRSCPVPVYKLIREFGSYYKFTVKYEEYVDSLKPKEIPKAPKKKEKKNDA